MRAAAELFAAARTLLAATALKLLRTARALRAATKLAIAARTLLAATALELLRTTRALRAAAELLAAGSAATALAGTGLTALVAAALVVHALAEILTDALACLLALLGWEITQVVSDALAGLGREASAATIGIAPRIAWASIPVLVVGAWRWATVRAIIHHLAFGTAIIFAARGACLVAVVALAVVHLRTLATLGGSIAAAGFALRGAHLALAGAAIWLGEGGCAAKADSGGSGEQHSGNADHWVCS